VLSDFKSRPFHEFNNITTGVPPSPDISAAKRRVSDATCGFQAILPKINNHDVERGSNLREAKAVLFGETYTGRVKNIRNVDGYHQKTMTGAYRCQYFENSI
jgi:hypothetical protein